VSDHRDLRLAQRHKPGPKALAELYNNKHNTVFTDFFAVPDGWERWADACAGPQPQPDWLLSGPGVAERDIRVLKTGKEADVHLIERRCFDSGRTEFLAAKRYRSGQHRMFRRDASYRDGRDMRATREGRGQASSRWEPEEELTYAGWAGVEFDTLCKLWEAGAPVPYPVQQSGSEVLMEYLGDADGFGAPRLAELRPSVEELYDLWQQLVESMTLLARAGLAHGDLSAFNLLVHYERLMIIDLPQVIDLAHNPRGIDFLARDARNMAGWFRLKGIDDETSDPEALTEMLCYEARLV
jgi:RIO kinase 1